MGNQKSENRRPKEGRNPKAEIRRSKSEPGSPVLIPTAECWFGFRFSVFGFPSVFGFRVSDFGHHGGCRA